jgi:Mor family transcriptional regulator
MSRNRRQACELIADLSATLTESLVAKGMANDAAAEIGSDVADKVAEHWGGQNVYFPFDLAARRNAQIYAKFTGDNQDKLATEFGTSVQHIYRVIKIQKAIEMASRQPMLFTE